MRRFPLFFLVLLVGGMAFAQQPQIPPQQRPHGVMPRHPPLHPSATAKPPAMQAAIQAAEPKKEKHAEEEEPAPVKWWDTQVLKNPQPPVAALFLNFAVLLLIFYRFGRKPFAEALKNRKVSIATAIENAQRILKEAKQRSKRYRGELKRLDQDAEEAKLALVATGTGEAEILGRDAEEKAGRIARDAKFLLEQESKQALLDLTRETVEKASREAEELLKKSVSAADHERLAEEFIAKLSKDFEKGLPV